MKTLTITPNWGEAFRYASDSVGFWLMLIGGLIMVGLAAFVFIKIEWLDNKLGKMGAVLGYALTFALLAGGLALAVSKPMEIRWENDKPISYEVKNYYLSKGEEGRKQYFDSLYLNCRLIGAPKNCGK